MELDWLTGARGSLEGLGSGQTANGIFQSVGGAGMILFQAFIFLIVMAVVIFLAKQMFSYAQSVYIFKKYGSGIKLLKFRGRHYKDKTGQYRFKIIKNLLQFRGKQISLVDQECFISNVGKGDSLFLLQVAPDDYKPILLTEAVNDMANEMNLTILDQNAANHALQSQKEIVDKHKKQNKMLMYLPTIMLVLGGVIVCVMLWMTLGRIEAMNSAMSTGYSQMAAAISDFGKQIIQ